MRFLNFLATVTILALVVPAIAQSPSFEPVGTISQLMVDIVYPTSNDIFYVFRTPPANDNEWAALQRSALMLAESGNLLMMRAEDREEWKKDSKLLIDVGAKAYRAILDKDLETLLALTDELNTACVTCHQQYHPRYRNRRQQ